MRKELEERLVARWPTWFRIKGDIRHTLMPLGFQHLDGWFDILWRLCKDLEPLVTEVELKTGRKFEVLQVKEKFGGLRFYTNQHTEIITERIAAAKLESTRTCEICGQPGTWREENGWGRTVCATCSVSES